MYKYFFFLLALFTLAFDSHGQSTPKTRILFVLDASGSMYAQMDNSNRIDIAKRLLTRLVDSLENKEDLEIALRIYGHQSPKTQRNCKDTKLEVSFAPRNHEAIKEKIQNLRPKGTTLIAYSLQEAAFDFPKDPNVRNVIILITDGIEECDGDPCAVAAALKKQGVTLRPFIIGLGLSEDFKMQFECVGRYFEAETERDFHDVLNVVINQAINNTTAQVNLLNQFGSPTETDVAMTFSDAKSGEEIYQFMHTIDFRGNPDTMYIDPSYKYDLKIHSIPPVIKKDVLLMPGIHNQIAVDVPQGQMKFQVDGNTKYDNLQALILDPKTKEIINVQDFNTTERYLVGEYDIEILTLPRITQKGVNINQSKTTTLQILQPGKLNLFVRVPVVASIFREYHGKTELVKNIDFNHKQGYITLQPGKYTFVYRKLADKRTDKSKVLPFEISSAKNHFIEIK